jgi:periplasmic protein CpxP/Spy
MGGSEGMMGRGSEGMMGRGSEGMMGRGSEGMMGRGFAGMMYPGAIERRVNRMLGLVDASTEQKQKVRAIFEKAATDLYASRDQRRANRRAMAEALAAATIDKAKIEQLRADRMKLADGTSKRLTDAVVEAAEVLTPAQRADLAARFQRRGD